MGLKALESKAKRETLRKAIEGLKVELSNFEKNGHKHLAKATAERIKRFERRLAAVEGDKK